MLPYIAMDGITMAYKTLQERITAYLLSNGFVTHPIQTRKYICFKKYGTDEKWHYYFIGSNGAVRSNTTGKVSESYSITDAVKHRMVIWEFKESEKLYSVE
jgi:hypothetical protein